MRMEQIGTWTRALLGNYRAHYRESVRQQRVSETGRKKEREIEPFHLLPAHTHTEAFVKHLGKLEGKNFSRKPEQQQKKDRQKYKISENIEGADTGADICSLDTPKNTYFGKNTSWKQA